ncbi:MAG: hypothetical protein ACJA13_000730 [Paraglaciecola sp.]|jgi:hypothetical protein
MGVTSWRPLTRIITAVVAITILTGSLLYAFRQPIAVAVLEHFTTAQDIEVSCLEVELHLDLSLSMPKLCLVGSFFKLQLHDAHWAYNTNQLVIDDLAIEHIPNTHDEEKSAGNKMFSLTEFSLPAYLPRLTVKLLQLQSPMLTEAMLLRVDQPSSNRIMLEGDVQAQAILEQGMLKLDIIWTLAEVLEKLPFAQALQAEQNLFLFQDTLVNAPIHTKVLFDGQRIDSQHNLDMASTYAVHDNCQIGISTQGTISANVNLANKNAVADLSALDSQVSVAKNCWQAANQVGFSLPQQLNIEFKDKISLDMHAIVVPQMRISDSQNGQIMVQLTDLNLPISPLTQENLLKGAFSLSLNLPVDNESQKAGTATLRLDASGQGQYAPDHWQLESPNNTLTLQAFSQDLSLAKANTQFSTKVTSTQGLTLQGQASVSGLSYGLPAGAVSVKSLTSQFSARAMNLGKITVELQNTLANTHYKQFVLKTLTNQLELTLNDLEKLTVTGRSDLNGIAIDVKDGNYLLLGKVKVDHNLTANRTSGTVISEHQVLFDEKFSALIKQQQQQIDVNVIKQLVSGLTPALHSLVADANLTGGLLSADLVFDIASLSGQGTFDLQELFAQYQEFAFAGLTTSAEFTLDSAGLQLDEASLTLDSAQVGLPITDIQTHYKVINSQVKITGVTANLLGGSAVTKDLWLDGREQTTEVQIKHMDLGEIIKLQQQPGIELSGEIQGTLPLMLTAQGIKIIGGRITSQGPGKLRIKNNPAFESIKAQQTELAYLQALDFKQLSSNVRLDTDGWLFLDFSILGNNTELGQAVNFNYSHEENILTLLRSLRLTDTVQNKIEKKIKQGGEK